MKFFLFLFLAACLLPSPASADQLQDGWAAYARNDYQAAMGLLQPLAEQGNADAQNDVGCMYENGGPSVQKSYAEAMKWYFKSADKANPYAEGNIARMYISGWGVPQDYAQAMNWAHLGADQGNAFSQRVIGWMYWQGKGASRDNIQAHIWLAKAAEGGDKEAVTMLEQVAGQMNRQQLDEAQRLGELYAKAEAGDPTAEAAISDMYENSNSNAQDYQDTYFWSDLVAAGNQDYISHRDSAASHLTPEQRKAVDRRIKEWKPRPVSARR